MCGDYMFEIFDWIICIFAVIMIIYMIVWNIVHLVYAIKCFKVWQCSNNKCRFKYFCVKYQETGIKEDMEKIYKLLKDTKE